MMTKDYYLGSCVLLARVCCIATMAGAFQSQVALLPRSRMQPSATPKLNNFHDRQNYRCGTKIFADATTEADVKEGTHMLEGRPIAGPVKPLNNFILVKVADADDQTEGGILLTGKAKQKKTEGLVIACGPGRTHQESGLLLDIPVSEGDSVVYGKYDGTELEYDGSKHTLIRDDDVLIKYRGDALTLDAVEVTNDNVLVYVEESEQETSGGLLIAQSSSNQKRPSTGEVVKVGPGRRTMNGDVMAMEVDVGDFVKFRDFAGNEVKIEGKEYSVVRMTDILAKF